MPKEKPFEQWICSFYRANTIDLMLFVYIETRQDVVKNESIRQSIERFMSKFDISDDMFQFENAVQVYYQMLRKYRCARKQDFCKTN